LKSKLPKKVNAEQKEAIVIPIKEALKAFMAMLESCGKTE